MSGFVRRIPEGDSREHMVCADCGHIAYVNPKVVVGAVVVAGDSVLLCRRAIEPRQGFWTLPAGFLELGETLQEGAARETWEEAQAPFEIDGILGIFSINRIGQVHVMLRARFATSPTRFAAGVESLEVRLFAWERIPWDRIAFPSMRWALDAWHRSGGAALGVPFGNPPDDVRGTRLPWGVPLGAPPKGKYAAGRTVAGRGATAWTAQGAIRGWGTTGGGRMTRIGLVVLTVLLAAASPPHRPLPLMPPPPLPTDGQGPTPDRDASAPAAPSTDDPRLTAQFVQVSTYRDTFDQSLGCTTGSRRQEDSSDRRLMPSPGVRLLVPFK